MNNELMLAHRALCSPFIDDHLYRQALGGTRANLGTIGRYLTLPVQQRPVLSVYFDREFYIATNADIRGTAADPLLHFIEAGFRERRSPHPLIDLDFIVANDAHALGEPPDIATLIELLNYDLADPSPYFDLGYYGRELGPGAAVQGLLRHFLTEGLWSGRKPNAHLDPAWYATAYADVPKDPYGALRHFLILGDVEGRSAGPAFDGRLYRSRYPDVAEAGVPALRHFMTHGRYEKRQAATERLSVTVVTPQAGQMDVALPVEVDPAATETVYAEMRARLETVRQRQKDAAVLASPPLVTCTDPVADLGTLRLPMVDSPRVSVLIPVYNELDYTVACLLALARAEPRHSFEVVIADDCSTDADVRRFADVVNLVYVRQPTNLGFIRNCNAAFARCRGDYVLLLNNDTQLLEGALDHLVDSLDREADVAAVGPKLIYPDGRLQEAGCFIRPNGESGMVGLFRDPAEGGFNRDRDVTYCSGAALLFRRALAGDTLFDETFCPAYCEDADLCLRFIAAGYRVRYVHEAVVVHHLSVSTNRQSVTRKLRTIVRNQQKLTERWGEALRRMDRVRPIAFYLPQFHPTPENDLWWGAGFTEWTNVAKARPSYVGHYQPHLPSDLGFYDLRTPEALTRQAELAGRYGIEGFCVYYYSFGSRRVLSRPLEVVRENPDIPFHFCLCWANENWTKHWDGGTREILLEQSYDDATTSAIIEDVVGFAADKRAIRVGGKPLFLVYRPLQIPDPQRFAASCRASFARAGFPGVHLVYVESMEAVDRGVQPADLGFDACVEFPPHGRAVPVKTPADIIKPGWSGYRYDYPETVMSFVARESVPYVRYPAVFPTWDNTARQAMQGTSFDGCSPEAFRFFVEEKIEELRQFHMGDERLLFVNAWNEWAEGAHLEPDTGYGHRWIEALSDAVHAKRCA